MKDGIFDLIHSLTPFEKAYIKKFASKSGDIKSNLLVLFDAISKQEQYDEDALLKKFRKEPFVKHFAVTKHQLFKFILKSLKNIKAERNKEDEIFYFLDEIKQLLSRSLFHLLPDYIKIAKQHAYTYELWFSLLEVIKIELRLLNIKEYDKDGLKKIPAVLEEQKNILDIIYNINIYSQLATKQKVLLREHFYIRDENQRKAHLSIIDNEYLGNVEKAKSVTAKIDFYFIHYYYAALTHNRQKAFEISRQSLQLVEDFPEFMSQNIHTQLSFLHIILYACYYLHKTDEMEIYLTQLKNITTKSINESNIKKWYSILFTAMFLRTKNEVAKLKTFVLEILKNYNAELIECPVEFRMNIIIHSSMGLVEHKEYKLASDILHKGLHDEKSFFREDLQIILKIVQIVIHFEQQEYEFTSYLLSDFSKSISKIKPLTNFEKMFNLICLEMLNSKLKLKKSKKIDKLIDEFILLEEKHKDEIDKDLFPFVLAFFHRQLESI